MYLQMDKLDNPLSTRPILTGRECTIDLYWNARFRYIDNLDRQFGAGSVLNRTRTQRDDPERLLTPGKERRSGTARTVRHARGFDNCQNGQKGVFARRNSRDAIPNQETSCQSPRREEGGVEFPWHENVKAAMERHQAMLWVNQTDGGLPCQNRTAWNPQTRWRCKGMGARAPERLSQPTPQLTPQVPDTPLDPPGNVEAAQLSENEGMPPRYVYLHTALPSAQCFTHDADAKDCKPDKECDPALLTDEETSTG